MKSYLLFICFFIFCSCHENKNNNNWVIKKRIGNCYHNNIPKNFDLVSDSIKYSFSFYEECTGDYVWSDSSYDEKIVYLSQFDNILNIVIKGKSKIHLKLSKYYFYKGLNKNDLDFLKEYGLGNTTLDSISQHNGETYLSTFVGLAGTDIGYLVKYSVAVDGTIKKLGMEHVEL